jgi:hypothetical protein
MMSSLLITEYTKEELEYLSDIIQEKLTDIGYENIESFCFSLSVEVELTESNNG